jgi:uncharacterized protein YebE (UPF0316 family)
MWFRRPPPDRLGLPSGPAPAPYRAGMALIDRLLTLLRLTPQPHRPGRIDVSIDGSRRQAIRDRVVGGPDARRRTVLRWLGRIAAVVVLLGALGLVLWAMPAIVRVPVLVAAQVAALRVGDVTLGVFRTTFIVRGRTTAAAVTAGLESLMWITAASVVLGDMSAAGVIGFASGVAIGTAIGVRIVAELRLGVATVRVFAPEGRGDEVAQYLRDAGQGATVFPGRGRDGPVDMVMSVMKRREAEEVCAPLSGQPGLYVVIEGREGNPKPGGVQ